MIISAADARRKSEIIKDHKEILDLIAKTILEQTNVGAFSAIVRSTYKSPLEKIEPELFKLGYKTEIVEIGTVFSVPSYTLKIMWGN